MIPGEMTAEEIIEGLEKIKAWEPREFIIDACDAAIAWIKDVHTQLAATQVAAEEADALPADAPGVTLTGDTLADATALETLATGEGETGDAVAVVKKSKKA